jgi:hypothetical protein
MSKKKNKSTGNPVPEAQSNFDRSSGAGVAYAHENLRQSDPDFGGGFTMQARSNPVTFVGSSAFHNSHSNSDTATMRPQPDHGRPQVQVFDAAGDAGRYTSMHPTNGFDYGIDHLTGRYDSAPTGASSTGSHDTSSPCTTPRPAMKASEARDILKRAARGEL